MNVNQRKTGAVLGYVLLFIKNGIALLFLPFMLRMLGQEEYGLYQLVGSLSAYLSVLDLGLSSTVTRYVAKYRTHGDRVGQERFVSLVFIIYAVLAVLVIVAGMGLYRFLPALFQRALTTKELAKARTMFLLLVASASVTVLTNGFRGVCTAYERFVFLRLQDIAQILLRVVVLVILLSRGYGAVAIVVTDLVLNVLFAGLRIIYTSVRLRLHFSLQSAEWTLFSEVIGFAVFIFLNTIINQIYWKTGNIILGVLTNTALVAVYSIGVQVSAIYLTFSTAISSVLLPQTVTAVENHASGSDLTDLMIRMGRIQLLILGLILTGFVSFGQEFILLWVGSGYEAAFSVAFIVLVPLTIPLVQNVGIAILQAKNKHQFRSLAYLVCALLNVVISIVLVPTVGITGAAWGTAIGLTLGNIIVINIYYHRVIGLEIPRFFIELSQGILPILLLMLAVGAGINRLWGANSWLNLLAKITAFALLYAVGMWTVGMNTYEKRLILPESVCAAFRRAD